MNYIYSDSNGDGTYSLRLNHAKLPISGFSTGTAGKTYSLLLGLPYYTFLRMARDAYGGILSGRDSRYPLLTFKSKENAEKLARELNKRAAGVMKERERRSKKGERKENV